MQTCCTDVNLNLKPKTYNLSNVRIIAGHLKGQIIASPHGHKTHPMSERMRGAMFNTLGDITGLTCLDAFAGSGSVGIEAISRGASFVVFIDSDKNANQTIAQNLVKLKLNNAKNIRANSASWSKLNSNDKFDLVICDPPYDSINIDNIMQLASNVKQGGLFILSAPKDFARLRIEGFELVADKSFADGSIIFYKMDK